MAKQVSPRKENVLQLTIIGPSNSGKTTILKRISSGILEGNPQFEISTRPTLGFETEILSYNYLKILTFDIGGQTPYVQMYWKTLLPKADGILFVIDAANPAQFSVAREYLREAFQLAPKVPYAVLANKQDLERAVSPEELESFLGLTFLKKRYGNPQVLVFGTSGLYGVGLKGVLEFLLDALVRQFGIPFPTVHHLLVYERDSGIPLAKATIKGIQSTTSQSQDTEGGNALVPPLGDPVLISAFYTALDNYAKKVSQSSVRTVTFHPEKGDGADYLVVNYSDRYTRMNCLVIADPTENVYMLEKLADYVIRSCYKKIDPGSKVHQEPLDITNDVRSLIDQLKSGKKLEIPSRKRTLESKPKQVIKTQTKSHTATPQLQTTTPKPKTHPPISTTIPSTATITENITKNETIKRDETLKKEPSITPIKTPEKVTPETKTITSLKKEELPPKLKEKEAEIDDEEEFFELFRKLSVLERVRLLEAGKRPKKRQS